MQKEDRVSEDERLLRSYVADLLKQHEANPAPGAAKLKEGCTIMHKSSLASKWQECQDHFKSHGARVPGSKTLLGKAFKAEVRLIERKACSHAKCTFCCTSGKVLVTLQGVNTQQAINDRAYTRRALREHCAKMLLSRAVLDDAGYEAIVHPRRVWTLIVDAATQRNFELPRLKGRKPKALTNRLMFGQKLIAVYAYGFGTQPFLVHDAHYYGSNLTWTVIWLTLEEMHKKRNYWPDSFHIQLDNTVGENKNWLMVAMSAWFVSKGIVARVRVYFLDVGHTHVIIDQIFGVITVALRGRELLTPSALESLIDDVTDSHPQWLPRPVRTLHCLFDFQAWCTSSPA